MPADFAIKRADTRPFIKAILKDNGAPIDLTTASEVRFLMSGGGVAVGGSCQFGNREAGEVIYAWTPQDTFREGQYQAEWEVRWADGGIETFPDTGYNTIVVVADLG
jgi:hypothetical protein